MTFPETIGACVDLAYKLRQQRLKLEKEADKFKEQESALKEHLIKRYKKEDLDGSKGKVAVASIGKLTVARVNDWDKFHAYIRKTGEWDLLKKSVNDAAYRARIENKKKVPGVEPFTIVKVHVNKK